MRRLWAVCTLLLSLTAAANVAANVTRSNRATELTPVRHAVPATRDSRSRQSSHWTQAQRHRRAHHAPAGRYLFGDRQVESNVDFNPAGRAESFPFGAGRRG